MHAGTTLFAQVMDFLPWKTFHCLVARYEGNRGVRALSCAEQYRVLAFAQARALYSGEDLGLELDSTVYALDSSTIDLCMSVFPWALFRTTKSGVKLRTLLYRNRWQVELFFKWIKQHLRIKSFYLE